MKSTENETIKSLEAKNLKMAKIIEVVKVLSSQRNFDDLLSIIIRETTDILEADRTSLFIYDSETKELRSRIAEKSGIKEIRFGIDKGIAGYVARTKKLLNIEDAYENDLFNPVFDTKTGFCTKNILCMPMESYTGKLIGVIEVMNKKSFAQFTKEDEEIITIFASLVAVLIENAILAEENIKKDRLATIGNMASTIVHDLKNPMTTIRGYAELMIIKAPELMNLGSVIVGEIDRFTNMTHELLEYSKGIEMDIKFEPIVCDRFFKELFVFLSRDFEKLSIDFVHSIKYFGEIEINPDKIRRAVFNIAGNARDALEEGGSFIINIEELNENICISMEDTGKGIPAEIKDSVFDAFVTHDKKRGTGLGLAITKKIIDLHNGSISLESEEGKGTRFEILLPKSHNTK